MSEIFISYRRGDGGWAGRLADRLQDRFPVFFDRSSIEGGAEFTTEITDALAQTRIFLAVIGKRWLEQENLERLGNAQDWVGREILAALARRPAIRVVPILVEGVAMPGAQALPRSLADFVVRNAIALDDDSWDNDVGALIADIDAWLAGSGTSRAASATMPPDLPFLCDRVEQEDDLIPLAQSANRESRAFACILHGHKWESHDGFLSRLRQQRVLEALFDAADTGVDVYPLEWNRTQAQNGAYAELLRRAIKGGAMQRRSADDAELAKFLRRPGRPDLLVLQVTWADLQACRPDLLAGLEQAWKDLIAGLGRRAGGNRGVVGQRELRRCRAGTATALVVAAIDAPRSHHGSADRRMDETKGSGAIRERSRDPGAGARQ